MRDAVVPISVDSSADVSALAAKDITDDNLLEGLSAKSFPRAFDIMDPDYDSFILAYVSKDPYAKDLVERFAATMGSSNSTELETSKNATANNTNTDAITTPTPSTPTNKSNNETPTAAGVPRNEKEYIDFLIQSEQQRDAEKSQLLAQDVLDKSAAVDDLVANLPGMNRTRQMQMERIEELMRSCHSVARELEEAHIVAIKKREQVREALEECTCLALGVEEEGGRQNQ